jgi:FMN reductase
MTDRSPSLDLVVLVGNPSRGGRTTRTGRAVASAIAAAAGVPAGAAEDPFDTIELADVAGDLFEWGNQQVASLKARVSRADVVVVASPTYKATYTGLLKAFLDTYGDDDLAGCRAVPVMVGASPGHALAVELHLRPLLVELGASVPSRGLYLLESEIEDVDQVVADWSRQAAGSLLSGLSREG